MKLTVKKKSGKKMKQGYPLIQEDDLVEVPVNYPTDWVSFVDESGTYIATGYLAKQNKGIGWLVNWQGEITTELIYCLFCRAKEKRQKYFFEQNTSAYRLFNGEGDGLGGLTIDRYNDYVVFSWYNDTLYTKKSFILEAFLRAMPEIIGVYEKIRFVNEDGCDSQFVCGQQAPEPLIIKENGVSFATYLNEGLMTGIFLDQKEVRGRLVDGLASGKKLLNMFSYTGAFSVAGAMGGAIETTSVDLAKRSLLKTKEQFSVNHLDVSKQHILVMDVFEFFKYAKRKKLVYDVIILDPPSFARNKKKTFSVAKNYGNLVTEAIDILTENGLLIASTNAANVSVQRYKQMISIALDERKVNYRFTETFRLPSDFSVASNFEDGNYLKVFFIEIYKK